MLMVVMLVMTAPASLQLRDLSSFKANKTRFDGGNDTEGNYGPYLPPLPVVETVDKDDKEIIPTTHNNSSSSSSSSSSSNQG